MFVNVLKSPSAVKNFCNFYAIDDYDHYEGMVFSVYFTTPKCTLCAFHVFFFCFYTPIWKFSR